MKDVPAFNTDVWLYVYHSVTITVMLIVMMIAAVLIGIAQPQDFSSGSYIGGFVLFMVLIVAFINYVVFGCRGWGWCRNSC